MSHEILGLREGGHVFKGQNWTAPTVADLLLNHEKYVSQIPEEDRFNIYFTVHHVLEKQEIARTWGGQDVMPFDIDDVDISRAEITAKFVCEIIGLEFYKTGVIVSGRGLQMFVQLENKIEHTDYFVKNRELYKLIVQRVNQKLKDGGFKGKMDPAVFSGARLMRMPGTINRKPKKGPDVPAYILNAHMEAQGFDLITACGAPKLSQTDVIHKDAWAKFPVADSKAVQSECGFLRYAKEKQRILSEPEWKACIGIVSFLPDGQKLAHEYSKDHPGYSPSETDFKFEQSSKMTGPRTCSSVNQLWPGCASCPWNGKIKTPLQIQGPDYIGTETHGFYKKWIDKNGNEKLEPAYEDLIKYFKKTVGPFFSASSRVFYAYNREKKFWEIFEPAHLENFAYDNMKPTPRTHICVEYKNSISIAKVKRQDWMDQTTKKKLNLQNGVLDIETGELSPHSEKFGFMSILPYAYDPEAKAPKFQQFLRDVTVDRQELINLLEEYMGYCISGDDCWIHKALILLGEGRNGKSTFNKVLKALVGPGYYSSLNMEALQNDQKRSLLEGKLFNLGDENNPEGLLDSAMFKSLIAGEEFDIKLVYKQPHTIRNRAKMIFNCNAMPKSRDSSAALFERLIFVPFDATFLPGDPKTDPRIEYKLFEELPGILNICLEAYKRLLERGLLPISEASQEILTDYRSEADTVTKWFDEHIIKGTMSDTVTADEMYESYYQFCERSRNKYAETRIEFGRKIGRITQDEQGFDFKRVQKGRTRHRVLYGAKIKTGF